MLYKGLYNTQLIIHIIHYSNKFHFTYSISTMFTTGTRSVFWALTYVINTNSSGVLHNLQKVNICWFHEIPAIRKTVAKWGLNIKTTRACNAQIPIGKAKTLPWNFFFAARNKGGVYFQSLQESPVTIRFEGVSLIITCSANIHIWSHIAKLSRLSGIK